MRKYITIAIAILSVIFLILVGAWLANRQEAKKSGQTLLSFREFLNLSSIKSTKNPSSGIGDVSSDFQDGGDINGADNNSTENGTRSSNFTNNTSLLGDGTGKDLNGDGRIDTDLNHDGKIDTDLN